MNGESSLRFFRKDQKKNMSLVPLHVEDSSVHRMSSAVPLDGVDMMTRVYALVNVTLT